MILSVYLIIGIVLAIQTAFIIWNDEFNQSVVARFGVPPNNDLTKVIICLSFVNLWPVHLFFAFMVKSK